MYDLFILHKRDGETPLERLVRFKKTKPAYANVPLTYAGRLDPMASGKLLILAGEKAKEKDAYLGLEKEYEFAVLLGASTDTGDILGLVQKYAPVENTPALIQKLKAAIRTYKGKAFDQKYPLYSSKPHKGRPLFSYARSSESIPDDEHPTKQVKVISINFLGSRTVRATTLLKTIEGRIARVTGDFRQIEILRAWHNCAKLSFAQNSFIIVKCKAKVTSGLYIRSLAENIGKDAGVPALAHTIKRTRIGKY